MNLARLNADGSLDRSFDTTWGADYDVTDLALQADGKILVVGQFTRINAVPCSGFVRLHPDGTVDASFQPVFNFEAQRAVVRQALVLPDGKLFVTGSFTNVNGLPRFGLARLNADGSLDPSFDAGDLAHGPYKYLSFVALQPDGRVLACGEFMTTDDRIVRLNTDGSLDDTFDLASLDPWHPLRANALAVLADGTILIGDGYEDGIYRLHAGGSLDDSFQPRDRILGNVLEIGIQPDGKILLGGHFSVIDQVPRRGLARLNSDGTLDTGFDPGDAAGPERWTYDSPTIRDLVLLTNGQALVGAEGASAYAFFRLQPDGARDMGLDVSFTPDHASVGQIIPLPNGQALIGGSCEVVNGAAHTNVARLNPDGSADATFDPGLLVEWGRSVATILRDGRWLISGVFTNLPGGPRSLARLNTDGTVDESFAPLAGHSYNYPVAVGAVEQADGKLVIYGPFESVGGVARHYIARLCADGSLDDSFVPAHLEIGDDWYITGVGVQRDGKIVVAGHIFDQPWSSYYGLARLNHDGSEDREFRARVRVNGPVFRLILQPDDKILFSGEFDLVNDVPARNLARLNADGSFDTSFEGPGPIGWGVPLGPVMALAPDGKILIGTSGAVWRLNPDGRLDPGWRCDLLAGLVYWAGVNAIAVEPDGDVLISGSFRSVNGVPAYGVVRLKGDLTPLPPLVHLPLTQQTRLAGQPASLKLDVAGLGPMTYQWLFNGAPIDGAYSATLAFSRAQPAQSGDYSVVVANPVGAVTSAVERVTVIPVPNTPGSVDVSFDPTAGGQWPGLGGNEVSINAIARLDDGRWLVGGSFVGINRRPRLHLARLHPGGSVDETFDTSLGPDGPVTRIAVQPNGQVVIVGGFSHINTQPCPKIARMNADATLDPGFAPAVEGSIHALAVQADGRVLNGSEPLVTPVPHPADLTPPTWTMSIHEVTAYGAAWRRGQTWPVAPHPIPIDYVTRAAFLWRGGECYVVDPQIVEAPLWWVNCASSAVPNEASGQGEGEEPHALALTTADRQLPPLFVPGEPMTVRVSVSPANDALAYAVEDQPPAGWTVTAITGAGEFDAVNSTVKWGPFLDSQPRVLSYEVTPPVGAGSLATFAGSASFDGSRVPIAGARRLLASSRLSVSAGPQPGCVVLGLNGQAGARYLIETSTDLVQWVAMDTVTCATDGAQTTLPASLTGGQRFYRARPLP